MDKSTIEPFPEHGEEAARELLTATLTPLSHRTVVAMLVESVADNARVELELKNTTHALAMVTHKAGGEVILTREAFDALPEVFDLHVERHGITRDIRVRIETTESETHHG